MDIEHCVIAVLSSEVAKFRIAVDKHRYNVLSICPVAHPFTLAGFGVFDAAKIHLFPDMTKNKILPAKKPAGIRLRKRAVSSRCYNISVFYIIIDLLSGSLLLFVLLLFSLGVYLL